MKKNKNRLDNFVSDSARAAIIIGENGSGKSNLLNELSKSALSEGKKVIAIANSIYDKFTSRNVRFHFLGARSGRNISQKTIENAIQNIDNNDTSNLRRISDILDYIGYSREIGIQLKGFKQLNIYKTNLDELEKFSNSERNSLESLISQIMNIKIFSRSQNIIWIDIDDLNFSNLKRSEILNIIKYQKILIKMGLMKKIQYFLRKQKNIIPLNQASSGELSFVTSMIYLSTVITDNSVILIDEPENSLHPTWQKEYLSKILDLFGYYQAKIIIATHSPLIVSGAQNSDSFVNIFRAENNEFIQLKSSGKNVESILWSFFNITTPESNFMSEFFVSLLNDLGEGKIKIQDTIQQIDAVKNSSYDRNQIETIEGVREIAYKIESRKKVND